MGKHNKPMLFRIEPVKPRNRVAAEGLHRLRGGAHVKPYGAVRQSHKVALRAWLDEDDELDVLDQRGEEHHA